MADNKFTPNQYNELIDSTTSYTDDGTVEESRKASERQSKAAAAYQLLIASFDYADSMPIHPQEYAGARIESDNMLHVFLTNADKESVERYDNIFGDLSDSVIYEVVQYSLNELDTLKEGAVELLKGDFAITCWFNAVGNNNIVIEIDTNDIDIVKTAIEERTSSRMFRNNFSVENGYNTSLFDIRKSELSKPCANVYGGQGIYRGSSTGVIRTIGVCGKITNEYGTYSGVVTAGHGIELSGDNNKFYKNGQYFGNAIVRRWSDGANGDFGCIACLNSNETLTNKVLGSQPNTVRNMIATVDDVAEGTTIYTYGATSGHTSGKVEANNVTVNSAGFLIRGLTRCDFPRQSGDSGSPFYTLISGSNYNFAGVAQGTSALKCWFTPYIRFKHAFTPYTS